MPLYAPQRAALRDVFTSEEEMTAYLDNPDQVTKALRDYIWSLSRSSTGTAAGGGGP
jgi:hypothetical protein